MHDHIRNSWAKALASGDYKQGRGFLRRNNKFCVYGVLCNLHAQAHPEIAKKQIHPDIYMGEKYSLPKAVKEWAGIKGDLLVRGRTLISLNDNFKLSFAELAPLIKYAVKDSIS